MFSLKKNKQYNIKYSKYLKDGGKKKYSKKKVTCKSRIIVKFMLAGISTIIFFKIISNLIPQFKINKPKFISLMEVIKYKKEFAKIYTDNTNSLDFKVIFTKYPSNRDKRLREERASGEWQLIDNLKKDGTKLLIPPISLESNDISDFANNYDSNAWNELFTEIKNSLIELIKIKPKWWIYTDGSTEDYLHIRFEPFPKRKYL